MSTSKLLGAICTGALLLSAGCTTNNQTLQHSDGIEAVTAGEQFPLAVLDERAGQVLAVTFDFDRDTLDQKARALLDAQAGWMAARPEFRFSATGHADKVGTSTYNLDLGRRRAERVVEYLVAAGIERDRLEALVSHGEYDPLVQTENPERLNRRVVIEVAGFVEEVSRLDPAPWWRHTPRPYLPNLKDGPKGNALSRSLSDTTSGSSGTTGANSTAPTFEGDGNEEPTLTVALVTGPSGGNAGLSGSETGSGSANSSTSNEGSGGSGSTPPNSESGSATPSSRPSGEDSNSTGENTSVQDEGSTGSGNKSGSQKPEKNNGAKGSRGNPSKSNPSSDRVDAGGGNGPEAGGDPGASEGRNQGGDDD